jgi:ATP-binding protein involved in chromosome partitioning
MKINKQTIIDALGPVHHPKYDRSIVALDMVSGIQISDDGAVLFMIEVNPKEGASLEPMRQKAESTIAKIRGVSKVTAVMTAQRDPSQQAPQKAAPDPHGIGKIPRLSPPIKHIVAVASGKGGVGKSTVSANLAVALARSNPDLKIGLLDADIYGPSQPLMMGLQGQKPILEDGVIQPLTAHGVTVMSIGFMVQNDAPLIWRGPMVQTAIVQLFRDVNWGSEDAPLDILIVDLPPGTGDAQLTMAQKIPMAGAVIVSTPQDIALLDARKAIEMFDKTDVPILGLIENMSTHICSNCGHEDQIFGHGGAEQTAKDYKAPFLGNIPLNIDIRKSSDEGEICASQSETFSTIAAQILDRLAQQ